MSVPRQAVCPVADQWHVPEKLMVWPTIQQGLLDGQAAGVSMNAVGAVLFALIVTELVAVALCLSVTLRLAV